MILRLIKYRHVLIQFHSLGMETVFSNNLGDAAGISATLVRKDLSRIDFPGSRRGGYAIDAMLNKLDDFLGRNENNVAIVIGCGNLGRALLNHESFPQERVQIIAGFDIVRTEESINNIPVYSMENLQKFVHTKNIQIALLAVPGSVATKARDTLISTGIQGILNFTSIAMKNTPNCIINNVNIGLEIENLFFLLKAEKDWENRVHNGTKP